jgi:uncharacterized protein with NRDE domain
MAFRLFEGYSRMCLVFISYQSNGKGPVLIGANREESRRRPTTSPVCCNTRGLRCLLAGADHGPDGSFPAMGTWLGVNEAGMAVAITNRHDGELSWADQVRSRGLLAVSLLASDSPDRAAEVARSDLAQGGYGGCNFLVASADAAFVVQAPGPTQISVTRLEPGIHAMTNLDLDDQDDPRIRLVRATLDARDFITSAGDLCRDERIVVAGTDRGTVSSSLIVAGAAEIVLYQIQGDPRGHEYQTFRLRAHD